MREFKEMVKAFHKAGIEVILDVVYNHTGEGNENGPTLSFRGLDNVIYYMLDREGRYYNFSGCGNTLNCNHPLVRDLIIDSLTVSGRPSCTWMASASTWRPILGRGANGKVLDDPPLIQHIAEHPVLAGTKLIAEAWDAAGLSQLGKFPAWGRWAELNGCYRDDVRRFIRGDAGAIGRRRQAHLRQPRPLRRRRRATRITRSTSSPATTASRSTIWSATTTSTTRPTARTTATAGTTTSAATTATKGRRDNGHINAVRQRQMRNFLTHAADLAGRAVPAQGDEFGRTQRGNNNAYCQDNDISWVDWTLAREERRPGAVRAYDDRAAEAPLRPEPRAIRQPRELARRPSRRARLDRPSARSLAFTCPARPQPRPVRDVQRPLGAQRFTLPRDGRALEAAGGHEPAVAGRHRRGAARRAAAPGGPLLHVVAVGGDPDGAFVNVPRIRASPVIPTLGGLQVGGIKPG